MFRYRAEEANILGDLKQCKRSTMDQCLQFAGSRVSRAGNKAAHHQQYVRFLSLDEDETSLHARHQSIVGLAWERLAQEIPREILMNAHGKMCRCCVDPAKFHTGKTFPPRLSTTTLRCRLNYCRMICSV